MNKSYKSVWNESTGSWVAVSELATGRSKSKRAKTAISKAILTQVAVGGMSLAGVGVAMADDTVKQGTNATVNIADGVAIGVNSEVDADTLNAAKIGGIAIGDSAYAIGSGVAVGQNSQAGSDSLAFGSGAAAQNGGTAIGANSYSINNGGVAIGEGATATGAGGMAIGKNASASASGAVAIGQDSVATGINTVSVGNATTQRQIANLAAGTHATDAVNLAQLTAAGLIVNTSGVAQNAFVAYDSTAKTGVTLGTGTVGAQIHQVVAGTTATDAVNVGQLTAAGLNIDTTGKATNSFVAYSSTAKDLVTLGGSAGTKISNLTAGTTAMDAVNVGQLTAAGLIVNTSGVVQNSFVAYDSTAKTGVTLGTGTVGAQIHQVVAGTTATDAVNVGQLTAAGLTIDTTGKATNSFVAYSSTAKDLVTLLGASGTKISNVAAGTINSTSKDAVNGSQLYNAEASVAAVLGGSASVNPDGTIKAPTYKINNTDYTSLDSALTAAAASGSGGGADPLAVQYTDANKTAVSLGNGTTAVKVTNVAAGVDATDAVNKAQLDAVSNTTSTVANSLKYLRFGASSAQVANAMGTDSLAIGGNAFASQTGSVAIGLFSNSSGLSSVAIGSNATADGKNSVALGSNSSADDDNIISVGNMSQQRRITNVAAGTTTTDAVNMGQVESMITAATTPSQQMVKSTRSLLGASVLTAQAAPVLSDVVAVGTTDKLGQAEAIGTDAVAIGLNAKATNDNTVAIGTNVAAGGVGGVAIGNLTTSGGVNATAIGVNAQSMGDSSLAMGTGVKSQAANSIALGNGNNVLTSGSNSVAIGYKNSVSGANTIVLGNQVTGTGTNSVVLGNASDGSQSNVVSVGAKGTERKIVNVAAGTTATDAVNVGQLAAAGVIVNSSGVVQNTFVAYDSTAKTGVTLGNGTVGAQIHQVVAGTADTDATNVAQLKQLGALIGTSGTVTNAFVAYDNGTSMDTISLRGTSGTTKITKLTAGTLSASSTDAVNGSQLYNVGSTTAAALGGGAAMGTDGKIKAPAYTIGSSTYADVGTALTAVAALASGGSADAVVYDSTTHNKVTLGKAGTPVTVSNVADGAANNDAVNVEQLKAAGLNISTSGVVQNAFVAYDSTAKTGVTLGNGTVGAQIHQVVAGTTATDAVNVGQLTAAGLTIDTTGKATNSFVAYSSTAKDLVTLGGSAGTKISNLTAGTTAMDAVNVGQLTAAGLIVNTSGVVQNSFVAYDSTAKTGVTLGTGTVGAQIHQVVAGTTATDAVNVGQLTAAGLTIDTTGKATNSFVAYSSTAKDLVTLGGSAGTKISNVKAGTTAMDAVNIAQLTAAGLNVNTSGVVQNAFVAYDSTAKTGVTLGNGTVGAQIHQVVAGTADTDATNVAQLKQLGALIGTSGTVTNAFVAYDNGTSMDTISLKGTGGTTKITKLTAGTLSASSTDAVNGTQLYNVGSSAAAAIGGTATMGADGKISKPSIVVGTTTYDNLSGAITAAAALAGTGSADAVRYDSSAHSKITLGSTSAPVTVTNVATGVDATDAVNKAQLDSATSAISNSIGNLSPALKYLRFGSSTAQTANAMGTDSLALGGNAFASQTGSVAIGLFSNSSGLNSVAIGARATADGQNSVAIGSDSSADGDNTVSVGNMSVQRRITNVAAGTTTTDAVNLGQVESLISAANSSSQQVVKNTRTLLGASVLTAQAAPVLSDVVAVGTTDKLGQAEAIGTDAVAVGLGAHATNDNTVAIGTNVAAGGVGGVAIGNLATSGGASATAVGVNAQSMGDNSLAMGTGVKSQGANSIALGNGTNVLATGSNSIAIGYKNSVSGANSIVLGNQVVGTGTNSVVLGNSSDGSQSNVVSVGAKGTERKIVNVAAGTTTTDAVNLGQMNAAIATVSGGGGSTLITQPTAGTGDLLVGAAVAGTHVNFTNSAGVARELTGVAAGTKATSAVNLSQLQPVVTALGGGAKVDATTGAVTGPTYNVQGGTQSTVGDALTSLDSGLNTVSTKVAALGDLGPNLVTQAAAGSDLLVGSKTDGTHVNFAGTAGNRELINVAAGTKDTSAVNLSQLKPVVDGLGGGAKVDPTTGAVTGPSYTIQGSTVNNAGDAFKAVDGDLTDLKTTVADIAGSTGNGLVIQDATTRAIKVAPLNDGTVVDVTGSAGARTITGVAAGSLGASSLDAINGSQLNATTSNIATAIGGGMSVDSKTGAITMPSFSVGGQPMYNVGDAITGLDGRINSTNTTLEDLTTKVSNISTGGTGTATPNAVAYDTDAHDTLTLASTSGGTTKLSGLTDGNVAAGSTDAVTGNQLSEVKDSVTTLQTTVNNIAETGTTVIGVKGADGTNGINGANGVAGSNGTAASANGADAIAMGDNASASGDHAVVIGGGASGTADGVIAIGGNSNASGKDSIAIGNGASAPAENAVALGANSVADRDNSVSIGSEGNERQLTNVAAGTKGTDAVNLNQMNQAVGGVARKAYSGIAAATALTMIPDVDANKTLSIGIGGGTFQGYAATAIGGTARITQNIKVRVGAGWSAAGTTVGAGASYQW